MYTNRTRIAQAAAGLAPRGAFRGIAPPERGLCPEEINRLGAAGLQIEA